MKGAGGYCKKVSQLLVHPSEVNNLIINSLIGNFFIKIKKLNSIPFSIYELSSNRGTYQMLVPISKLPGGLYPIFG
jgi:hypothetical protein